MTKKQLFSSQQTARLISERDWSSHPLGPLSSWPDILINTLNMILNTQNPIFIFWGEDSRCFYNDGYIPILGAGKHPEVLGKPAEECWPEIWDQYTSPELQKARAGNSTWNVDQFIPVFRNGETAEAYFTYGYSPIYNSDGTIAGVLVVATETTEKILAQRELQTVFNQAPVGICVFQGPEHVFTLANDSYYTLLGRNRDIIGLPVRKALPDIEGQGFYEILDGVYQTGKPFIGKELPVSVDLGDGTRKDFFIDITYTPKYGASNKIDGVVAVLIDITSQVDSRVKAEDLAMKLGEALKSRDEFLSIASHELLTPVTSLKLQLQLTRRNVDPEKNLVPSAERLAKTLDISNRQVDRLNILISDLLDVSRIESGKMTYNFAPQNIPSILNDVVEKLSEQISASKTEVRIFGEENVIVKCDSLRLEQVFTNLLSNSIKYGGGRPVEIRIKKTSECASMTFRDQGIGISSDLHHKIFQRFERAVSSKNFSGLGLGLYITKQIVDAHAGSITFVSAPGEGTVFTVELPLASPK